MLRVNNSKQKRPVMSNDVLSGPSHVFNSVQSLNNLKQENIYNNEYNNNTKTI